jgi:hypothetical protein
MRIYLGSYDDLGRRASEVLRKALDTINPTLNWSSPNIPAGDTWSGTFEVADAGLFCLTDGCLDSPSLHYEIGYMAGRGSDVMLWLVGIDISCMPMRFRKFKIIQSDSRTILEFGKMMCQTLRQNFINPQAFEDFIDQWAINLEAEIDNILGFR